jgi:DNA-binding protein HU-beta
VIYVARKLFHFPDLLEVAHHAMATKAASGKKRMTQSEIVNHFAEKTGLKRAQVKEIFEELSNLAQQEVKSSGEFSLPGFGKLVLSERKAREGRNPATGETIQIPAKTTLKFRVGKAMKDTVVPKTNGGKKR